MSSLKIFISKYEKSYDAANKMRNESTHKCEIIFIEDFVEKNNYGGIKEGDVIHFSCNSDLIYKIIEQIKDVECFIFNKQFLLKKYNKLELQLLLEKNKIKIPQIYDNLSQIKLPVFCKENRHTGIIFKAFTLSTITSFISKFDSNQFYFEEDVLSHNSVENKYYYSNGKVHARNNKRVSKDIKNICSKINSCFNMDIYSVDVIKSNGQIFVIDLNPAVGFYLSDSGRKDFLKMVDNIFEAKK